MRYKAGYICKECAQIARCTWPNGHCATFHDGPCDYCNNHACVCATSDWDWPGKEMTSGEFGEREI